MYRWSELPARASSLSSRALSAGSKAAIDVLIAGEFPGDGLPKPVAFPDPATVSVEGERFHILPLATLLELKLASGMTAVHRLKDLADVLEVIRAVQLPESFADNLNPYVREKYLELWRAAQSATNDTE